MVAQTTYVIPPIATLYTIAFGVSLEGFGISSLICVAASHPISESADWTIPSTHAIPLIQPVLLSKPMKTKFAVVFFDVASRTILTIAKHRRDHITIKNISILFRDNALDSGLRAALFHTPMILFPYKFATVVKTMIAQKMRYVFHGFNSYAPSVATITAALMKNTIESQWVTRHGESDLPAK